MASLRILATAAALALSAPALAATQVVNLTLDLNNAGLGTSGFTYTTIGFSPFTPYALAEGDTLDFTIDFLGGQSLVLTNPALLWAFNFSGDPSSDVTGTGSLQLLNAAGNAIYTSDVVTSTEGVVHFGQQFFATNFPSLPTTLQFWGVRYTGTLDDYAEPGLVTRDYVAPAFGMVAGDIRSVVPEPASWAMMIAGFGLVGGALRQRRLTPALRRA